MGHLMTAACIHHRATGKKNFLDIATKVADYLYATFQPRPKNGWRTSASTRPTSWAPSNCTAPRASASICELAGIFVEMRGSAPGGSDQNQSRMPLRQETEAVGHAVTATYLYAGATDVYAESGEQAAARRPPADLGLTSPGARCTSRARWGICIAAPRAKATIVHEAFGLDYELPNRFAYTETCANIGNAMWNWRLLSLSGGCRSTPT